MFDQEKITNVCPRRGINTTTKEKENNIHTYRIFSNGHNDPLKGHNDLPYTKRNDIW